MVRRRAVLRIPALRPRVLVIVSATVLLLISSGTAHAQISGYGIVAHDLDAVRGSKVTELGTGFARISFRWWQIEPVEGQFDWTAIDDYVWGQAAPRGIRLFVTFEGPPEWAGGGPLRNQQPNLQAWYRFVRTAVTRYKGYVRHWGVWNEPNLPEFLIDRALYQDIAFWGRQGIKDADPDALVLGPEVSEHALDDGWFATVMNTWGRDYFDIATVHIYASDVANRMDQQVLPHLHGKEVWLTEAGEQAYSGNSLFEQLQRLTYSSVLNAFEPRRSWWTKVFFYDLWSWDRGYRFGICGPDWRNHLAFDFYRAWIATHRSACEYALSASAQTVPAAGGRNSVTITTTAGCAWLASSSAPWLLIAGNRGGSGPGTLTYTVAAYSGAEPRSGVLTIAGRSLVVTQAGITSGAPGSPEGLAAATLGSSLTLTWLRGGGDSPSSYVIEAGSVPAARDLANFDTGTTTTSFTHPGVGAGTYYVRVRAKRGAMMSAPSNEVVVRVGTGAQCRTPPDVPQDFAASVSGPLVLLTWTAASGGCAPVDYLIDVSVSHDVFPYLTIPTGSTATRVSATASPGTYVLHVRARNAFGASRSSNEAIAVVR